MNPAPQRRPAPAARPVSDVEPQVAKWSKSEQASRPAAEPLITFATRLPISMPKRIKQAALTDDRTVQDIVQEAIELWLAAH